MNHTLIALCIQLAIALPTDNWWAGAAAGAFYFIGREIAQAEYRNIESNYHGKRANMPWLGGFERRAWTLKGVLDWVLPTAVVCLIAAIRHF